MVFTDSHAHLTLEAFDSDRGEVLRRAREAGMRHLCTVGSLVRDVDAARELAETHDYLYFSAGLHPHDARHWSAEHAARLDELAAHPRLIALGEIGLDYYYDHSPRERQREAFREQIRIARRLRLPILIHTRDAAEDTMRILEEEQAAEVGGVFHCFSGDQGLADFALRIGFRISFSGSVTFKNAGPLRDVAAAVPPDRLLTETDAPFLSPHPHRGKRNEPARTAEVVVCLAGLHAMTPEAMGELTARNFEQAFPRIVPDRPESRPD